MKKAFSFLLILSLIIGLNTALYAGAGDPVWEQTNIADGSWLGQTSGLQLNFDDTNNYLEITGGKIGIGTATIPHGGIGHAMVALDGPDNDQDNGPWIQITTDADDYPLLQIMARQHDRIGIMFDSYTDSGTKSSDAGSNFQIFKYQNRLRFQYDTGIAVGNAVTWEDAFFIQASSGYIGSGVSTPEEKIHFRSGDVGKPIIRLDNTNTNNFGPRIEFYKMGGTPADDDGCGEFYFRGQDSAVNPGTFFDYAAFYAQTADVTAGAESGAFFFSVAMNSTLRNMFKCTGYNGTVGQGEIIINDDGQDVDTIIEASGVATAFKVQGSDGGIFMGGLKSGANQAAAGAAANEVFYNTTLGGLDLGS